LNYPGVYVTGDIMLDNIVKLETKLDDLSVLKTLDVEPGKFILCTVHRDFNTDNPDRLSRIIKGLLDIAYNFRMPIIFPIHPRTKARLYEEGEAFSLLQKDENSLLRIISPMTYHDILVLEKHCCQVITDSGGVQREAFHFGRPGLILRPQTEWTEIVEQGWATLVDADPSLMIHAFEDFSKNLPDNKEKVYGTGETASKICNLILSDRPIMAD
jgi:UDP-N-acetylglucosamine 2-epimerase